ncbi:c-type cytochrome domain-containing protein [Portibacter lacus]|nr:c-type cytochrome domain-containing protein [Portibacter lacus]
MSFDFSVFVGRFHPLFVHLPIGMIIITLVLELIGKTGKNTLAWMWLISFASALFSIFTGWQLSIGSSYPENQLFWHKWLGISVAAISFLLWAITKFVEKRKNLFSGALKVGLIVLLSLGGHIGGQLTHGNDYLVEAAPGFIKSIAGYNPPEAVDLSGIEPDSITTYEHLIYPFLEQKCAKCHNEKSMSGNLDITSVEKLLEGGDGGEVVIPGDVDESELFRRVTLNQNNVKFMPTNGVPLTYYEMALLKWWIENGAHFKEQTATIKMPAEIMTGINKLYKIDFTPKPWYEKESGPKIDTMALEAFAQGGFKVSGMSKSDNYLEVSPLGTDLGSPIDFGPLKENIIILDLKNTEISDANFEKLSELKNLIRLQLNGSNTETEDLLKIAPLPRLESINLYGTSIDDGALDYLASFPSLKRIYTWQTQVTPEGIAALQGKRPDISVENGIN